MTDTPDDTRDPTKDGAGDISPISITTEMKKSYLDYAMSVIVSRALPDVRDGLKPVHRRILYAAHEGGYTHDKPFRKSANIVGDVIGRYHPHGDQSIYDALVRMAQTFAMSVPLIEGQGNFGSIDGDPPAAMRYTESRMARVTDNLLDDIDKDTVNFEPNYDGSRREPSVLPARFPNLLVNGAGGIAVGMATNIPPHNLGEIIDAAIALIDNPAIDDMALLDIVPGPDFPTGGLIIGRAGSRNGLITGRGSVIMRARTHIEETKGGREAIIATEIPYQVNKSTMVEKIAELVRDKRIEGISDLRDESDRNGIRVVVEVKRDASADIVLNQLFRFTPMQTSFGVNMLALNGGRPELMNLRLMLQAFLQFREEVVARRTKFELNKARDRAHVLVGLALAVANIDEIIRIIRFSPDPPAARVALLSRSWPAQDMGPLIGLIADRRTHMDEKGEIRLSDEQAQAILDLRLQRLTGLGRDEIGNEAKGLSDAIQEYLDILRSRGRVLQIIKDELSAVRDKFAVPRRSEFVEADLDLEDEAFIEREDMVVMVTHGGYVKRTALSAYRTQNRGGKGRGAMDTKDEDFVIRLFAADTHTEILFFSSTGMVYKQKVWRLPLGAPNSRGKALVNILPLQAGERITSVMPLPDSEEEQGKLNILFATRSGGVRRNMLADFVSVNRAGKIAMKLEDEGDAIVGVQICSAEDDVLMTTALGQCIRFPVEQVRVFTGRTSTGVRGIRLGAGDELIAMSILHHVEATPAETRAYLRHANALRRAEGEEEAEDAVDEVEDEAEEGAAGDAAQGASTASNGEVTLTASRIEELAAAEQFILTLTQDGMGKRASAFDYRITGRGGKGLIAHKLGKGGRLAASFPVSDADEIMLVTDAGQLIRCAVDQIRIAGRATQGVRVLRVAAGERVVSVERLEDQSGDETAGEAGGG
ncbi:MAG: DNA gyrase subunit A [Alphaproteobacteria bacterium]|nr:DNA gyrase subunit A [Alphaproteobacteria bacterium]